MSNASLELTAEQKLEALGYQLERVTPEGSLVQAVAIDGLTLEPLNSFWKSLVSADDMPVQL